MVVSYLRKKVHCWGFTLMDGSLVIMGDSLLLRFLLQWMVVSSLWEIVRYWDLLLEWMVVSSLWEIVSMLRFFPPMDGSLVIMGDNSLLRFLLQWMVVSSLWDIVCCWVCLLQWMVVSSLWEIVHCWDFLYSNGW